MYYYEDIFINKNIEIIVVNDGSNDNNKTRDVVANYIDKLYYFEKKNVIESKGEYKIVNSKEVKTGNWDYFNTKSQITKSESYDLSGHFFRLSFHPNS